MDWACATNWFLSTSESLSSDSNKSAFSSKMGKKCWKMKNYLSSSIQRLTRSKAGVNSRYLLLSRKVIDLSCKDIKPHGMNVSLSISDAVSHKGIAGNVLHLHQSVDLRQFVRGTEPIFHVYVSWKAFHSWLCSNHQRLAEIRSLQLWEFFQACHSVPEKFTYQTQHKIRIDFWQRHLLQKPSFDGRMRKLIQFDAGSIFSQRMQKVHGFAVTMTTNDNMPDIVDSHT